MKENSTQSQFYAEKEFWNNRFENSKGYFDWYIGWKELKPYLIDIIDPVDKILMVGCGNSKMSELMYKDNYRNIVNIDISDIIVQKMKNLYQENFEDMLFLEMDATTMGFEDNSFDLIIDKGTLDALMCSKNIELPIRLLTEMFRVTKLNSHFAVITYGEPELRLKFFMEALPKFAYELSCKQISLSLMSNLINSLRNNSSDFSVSQALKDKDVLVSSLFDACTSKLEDEVKNSENLTPEELSAKRKKLFNMKILKLAYKKKNKLLKEDESSENNKEDKSDEKVTKNDDPMNKNTSEGVVRKRSISIEANEIDLENPKENNQNPNKMDARRTCCYLYLFKKVKDN